MKNCYIFPLSIVLAIPRLGAQIPENAFVEIANPIQKGDKKGAVDKIKSLQKEHPEHAHLKELLAQLDTGSTALSGADNTKEPATASPVETLQWIQSHISDLLDQRQCSGGFVEAKVKTVELRNGALSILILENSMTGHGERWSAALTQFDLKSAVGNVELVRREAPNCLPPVSVVLSITTKPNSIATTGTTYVNRDGGKLGQLDGSDIEPLKIDRVKGQPESGLERRVRNGLGVRETVSRLEIPVSADMAERFKKAFEHLIKLHGGGSQEAF